MMVMFRFRPAYPETRLRGEFRFIRTIQSDHIAPDGEGGYRLSSKAFSPSRSDGGISGDLEELLQKDGLPPTGAPVLLPRTVGAYTLYVSEIRDEGLAVKHDPVPTDWYHGGIFGSKNSTKNRLLKKATVLVAIDQAEAHRILSLRDGAKIPDIQPVAY
jgi:hypothetical protein